MRNPTIAEIKELDYYFSLDKNVLIMSIGLSIVEEKGVQYSPKTLKNKGLEWFEQIQDKLFKSICIENQYCEKLADESSRDRYTLGVTIADIISGITVGVPPFMVVALLLKIGLDNFCKCENS